MTSIVLGLFLRDFFNRAAGAYEGYTMTTAADTNAIQGSLPKKAPTRPYVVFENGKAVAVIRTSTPSRAIAFHTEGRFEAVVADVDAIFALAKEGFEIVNADVAK